ncbi:MAG: hypothetical protein ACLTDF_06940 [Coprococcus sp.]
MTVGSADHGSRRFAYVLQKTGNPRGQSVRKSSEAASEETDSEASGNKTGEKISEKEGG